MICRNIVYRPYSTIPNRKRSVTIRTNAVSITAAPLRFRAVGVPLETIMGLAFVLVVELDGPWVAPARQVVPQAVAGRVHGIAKPGGNRRLRRASPRKLRPALFGETANRSPAGTS